MPSKMIIIMTIIVFLFLGINIFRALLRALFSPSLAARAKMSLSSNIDFRQVSFAGHRSQVIVLPIQKVSQTVWDTFCIGKTMTCDL